MQRSDELPAPARLPPPSRQVSKSSTQSEKIAKYLTGVGQNINPEAGACMKQAEPAIHAVIKCFLVVAPLYKKMYVKGYEIYQQLPHNVLYMIFGACLCFFGGTYVASIAAIEAFRQLGWQKTYEELQVIYGEVQVVIAASEEDDKVDRDNNGVADVDEMEPTELAQHKLKIAMTAIKAPEKLQTAWGSLFASYLAVLATLRLEFARTTAFALGIVEMAKFPIIRSLSPGVRAPRPRARPPRAAVRAPLAAQHRLACRRAARSRQRACVRAVLADVALWRVCAAVCRRGARSSRACSAPTSRTGRRRSSSRRSPSSPSSSRGGSR